MFMFNRIPQILLFSIKHEVKELIFEKEFCNYSQ